MEMPARIITASWVVKLSTSFWLGPLLTLRLLKVAFQSRRARPTARGVSATTVWPWLRRAWAAARALSAAMVPTLGSPDEVRV